MQPLLRRRAGRLYIGVSDKGNVVGVQIGKGTLEDLSNKIAQNTVPKLIPAVTTHQMQGKTVILVAVAESLTKPVTAFDCALRRSGRTNQVLSANEIAQLYLATRMTWDQTSRRMPRLMTLMRKKY